MGSCSRLQLAALGQISTTRPSSTYYRRCKNARGRPSREFWARDTLFALAGAFSREADPHCSLGKPWRASDKCTRHGCGVFLSDIWAGKVDFEVKSGVGRSSAAMCTLFSSQNTDMCVGAKMSNSRPKAAPKAVLRPQSVLTAHKNTTRPTLHH